MRLVAIYTLLAGIGHYTFNLRKAYTDADKVNKDEGAEIVKPRLQIVALESLTVALLVLAIGLTIEWG